MKKRTHHIASVVLVLLLIINSAQAIKIAVKAQLAQWLIHNAWQRGEQSPPWPWADTYPVAKLSVPSHNIEQYVLAGTDGTSLAFGPGWQRASAAFGEGTSLIAGHNDTHFRFLKTLKIGNHIHITAADGKYVNYQISNSYIVDTRQQALIAGSNDNKLLLITCYPFDSVGQNTPLRYVVEAIAVDKTTPEKYMQAIAAQYHF